MKLKTKVLLCIFFFLVLQVRSSIIQSSKESVVALPSPEELNEELCDAIFLGELKNIDRLLNAGADVNVRYESGDTPLIIASNEGYLEIVIALIAKGADVNVNEVETGKSLLTAVIEQGRIGIASALLENGADVNVRDKTGFTPLMTASHDGYLETVEVLLEKGANVNAREINHFTPLMLAVLERHIDIVSLLLEKGSLVNAEAIDGSTSLSLAWGLGYEDIVCLLLEKGAIPKQHKPGEGEIIQSYKHIFSDLRSIV